MGASIVGGDGHNKDYMPQQEHMLERAPIRENVLIAEPAWHARTHDQIPQDFSIDAGEEY